MWLIVSALMFKSVHTVAEMSGFCDVNKWEKKFKWKEIILKNYKF